MQLTGFAILACWFTIAVTYYADDMGHPLMVEEGSGRAVGEMTVAEVEFHSWNGFLGFAKMWDLLVSKAMLAMFIWNLNVGSTGLTFLEYKNHHHRNGQERAKKAALERGESIAEFKEMKNLMKFYYGFRTSTESY